MTIGERLKEERSRLGFNQTDLAAVGGVGKTTQINYEKGVGSPDAAYLAAIAEQGADVLYIVTGERKPQLADSISAEEAELLKRYRQLPDGDRAGATKMVTALAEMAGRYEVKKTDNR